MTNEYHYHQANIQFIFPLFSHYLGLRKSFICSLLLVVLGSVLRCLAIRESSVKWYEITFSIYFLFFHLLPKTFILIHFPPWIFCFVLIGIHSRHLFKSNVIYNKFYPLHCNHCTYNYLSIFCFTFFNLFITNHSDSKLR